MQSDSVNPSIAANAAPILAPVLAPMLAPAMQAAPTEIYLVDAATLRLVDVNQAALHNLGYAPAELAGMTPLDLAPGLDAAEFHDLIGKLGPEVGAEVNLRTHHRRRDGSSYPVKLCFLSIVREGRPLFLALGDDLSLEIAAGRALEQYQSRFNAVVNHMPGLVYQFELRTDGSQAYPYLSEGCSALLGLSVTELQHDPSRFLDLILHEDRQAYLDTMHASHIDATLWNWEGRIWVEAFQDVKWINLRATPQPLPGDPGGMQWDGIMTNITASKREQTELEGSRARLAELTDHIEQVKEQERARIAREIHDDLGGNLTAIKMALAMLSARLPGEAALQERAAYLDSLVDRTIEAVHRISLDLRPSTLDLGIVAALEWQAREFEKQMGIACWFSSIDADIDLDPDHASALFRIFQEALTNIAKHAHATRVKVTLRRQRQHLMLTICDNGRGITPSDRLKPQSFGLRGMSERARAMKGSLTLSPASGGGTMVVVKIQLTQA